MKARALLCFLFLPILEQAVRAETPPDTLVIQARLLDIPGTFPPNELYNYVYILKYRVLAVDAGAFPKKEILVGVYNPLIPRGQVKDKMKAQSLGNVKAFFPGAKHRLTLVRPIDLVWQEAIEDEYFDDPSDKYFAVRADVLKE